MLTSISRVELWEMLIWPTSVACSSCGCTMLVARAASAGMDSVLLCMAMCRIGAPLVSALMTEGEPAAVGSWLRMACIFWMTSEAAASRSVPK